MTTYSPLLTGIALLCPTLSHGAAAAYFNFNSNLSNSLPGYTLTAIDSLVPYTPPLTDYTTETVFGTMKPVLNITAAQGLNLDISALANRMSYTIVMDVRSSNVSSYNKLMSLDGGAADAGIYFNAGQVEFYPFGSGSTVVANEWERVALTYDGTTMNLYSGDPSVMSIAVTNGSSNTYFTLADTLQFLLDDASTNRGENSPLQISSLWLFDDPLSAESIRSLPVPEPSVTTMIAMIAVFGLARRRHLKG